MTIVATSVDSNHGSGTSVTTASLAMASDRMYVATVVNYDAGGVVVPTMSGWDQGGTQSHTEQVTVFYRKGSGTPGTATISCGSSQAHIEWIIDEYQNVLTTGTNGVNAFPQGFVAATPMSSTTPTGTLAAFADAVHNASYLTYCPDGATPVAGVGYTGLSTESDFLGVFSQYKIGQDLAPSCTQVPSTSWVLFTAEIAAVTSPSGPSIAVLTEVNDMGMLYETVQSGTTSYRHTHR